MLDDYAKANALASIAVDCISEVATVKKATKKKATRAQVVEILRAKRVSLHKIGADMQMLKHEIARQSGALKERDDCKTYEKSTKDGWVVYEDCQELRDKFAAHNNQLEQVKSLLCNGLSIKQVAEVMAPSPEWVNHWRERINELNNSGVV